MEFLQRVAKLDVFADHLEEDGHAKDRREGQRGSRGGKERGTKGSRGEAEGKQRGAD